MRCGLPLRVSITQRSFSATKAMLLPSGLNAGVRMPLTCRVPLESKSYFFFAYSSTGCDRVTLKGTVRKASVLMFTTRTFPSAA